MKELSIYCLLDSVVLGPYYNIVKEQHACTMQCGEGTLGLSTAFSTLVLKFLQIAVQLIIKI
jgi:hypothetical protein